MLTANHTRRGIAVQRWHRRLDRPDSKRDQHCRVNPAQVAHPATKIGKTNIGLPEQSRRPMRTPPRKESVWLDQERTQGTLTTESRDRSELSIFDCDPAMAFLNDSTGAKSSVQDLGLCRRSGRFPAQLGYPRQRTIRQVLSRKTYAVPFEDRSLTPGL